MDPYLGRRLVDERQKDLQRLAGGRRSARVNGLRAGRSAAVGTAANDPRLRAGAVPTAAADGSNRRPRPSERIGGALIRLGARLGGTVPSGLASPSRAASAR